MRRILLVEGSDSRPPGREATKLRTLWDTICDSAQVPRFDHVEPIDKGHIARLSANVETETIEDQIVRRRLAQPGDAIVVVWDARPPWSGVTTTVCRWRETIGLYQELDGRNRLPDLFRPHITRRRQDFEQRKQPSDKNSPPIRLAPGELHAVCIDPMFETLFCEERVIKQALGLVGQNVKDWPSKWVKKQSREAKTLLDQAIHAARRHQPKAEIAGKIGLDYTRNQEEWAAHFVRTFSEHWPAQFREQPVVERLRTLLQS